jgi:integrase
MVPHVCESTLGVAMGNVKHGLAHVTVHDFRRTARTHMAALGGAARGRTLLEPQAQGLEGVYNRHDYFEERRRALEGCGQLLLKLERQGPLPKKPAAARQPATTAEES